MRKHMVRLLPITMLLVMIPGCGVLDWFKEQFGYKKPQAEQQQNEQQQQQDTLFDTEPAEEVGEGVVTTDGKVAVTKEEFEQNMQAMIQNQPQLAQYLPLMGADEQKKLYSQIADMLAQQYVMRKYVQEQGLDKEKEYQEYRRLSYEQVEKALASRIFQEHLYNQMESEISDKEAKEYYEKNKGQIDAFRQDKFIEQPAGVKASMIQAENQEQAKKIAEKAKSTGDMKKAAMEFEASVEDLGTVTRGSSQPNTKVVSTVMNMENLPAIEVVTTDDGKAFVVRGTEKVEPKYTSFDTVKDDVKNHMLQERFTERYSQKIEELKNTYNVSVNEDVLGEFVQQIADASVAQGQSE